MSNNNIDINLCGFDIHLKNKTVEIDFGCNTGLFINDKGNISYKGNLVVDNNNHNNHNNHNNCNCGCSK